MVPWCWAGCRAYTDVWSCSHSHFSHFQFLLVAAEKTSLLRGGGGKLPRMFWLNKSKSLFFSCCVGCWVAISLCTSPWIREVWDSKISKAGRFYTLLASNPTELLVHGSQAIWLPSDPEAELVLPLTIQSTMLQPFCISKTTVQSWLI